MTNTLPASANPSSVPERDRLRRLRNCLLDLHKALLEHERANYERVHGRVSNSELLHLVIDHEQFGWLHSISRLVVRIDETLEGDDETISGQIGGRMDTEAPSENVQDLFAYARMLLTNLESNEDRCFTQRYLDVLQQEPDAVILHGEMTRLLRLG